MIPQGQLIAARRTRTLSARAMRIESGALSTGRAPWRPAQRGQCDCVARPCPYVGCRYNLYLDVHRSGSLCMNFPDRDPTEMPQGRSCALDVADAGGQTLDEVGKTMNVTRERVRQIEMFALARLADQDREMGGRLRALFDEGVNEEPFNVPSGIEAAFACGT